MYIIIIIIIIIIITTNATFIQDNFVIKDAIKTTNKVNPLLKKTC